MVIILEFPHCLNCSAYPLLLHTPRADPGATRTQPPAALMFASYCHHCLCHCLAALLMMLPTRHGAPRLQWHGVRRSRRVRWRGAGWRWANVAVVLRRSAVMLMESTCIVFALSEISEF